MPRRALATAVAPKRHDSDGLALFRRLTELSADALEAVNSADLDEVMRILSERAELIDGAASLFTSLATSPAGGASAERAGASPSELLDSARLLRQADERLVIALTSGRDQVSRDLKAFDSGGAARSAYEPRRRSRSNINVVR